jgi:purine-binding chemotaxis protein CheW
VTDTAAVEPVAPARDLLVLRLGEARFGLWIDEVLEIVRTPPISRLPLSSAEVPGVTSVRGDVIPVLDLGVRLLGAPAARPGRLVLVRHEPSGSLVGLLVDGVDALTPVADQEVRPAPAAAEAALAADLMTGVVARDEGVVTVLDLSRAAAPPAPSTDER